MSLEFQTKYYIVLIKGQKRTKINIILTKKTTQTLTNIQHTYSSTFAIHTQINITKQKNN